MTKTRFKKIMQRVSCLMASIFLVGLQAAFMPVVHAENNNHNNDNQNNNCQNSDNRQDNNFNHIDTSCSKGSVKVHKKVYDASGNYVGGDSTAIGLDFKWGLDGGATNNLMGDTVSSVSAGSHTVSESPSDSYAFTGWYYDIDILHSCSNLPIYSKPLPANIIVLKDLTTSITLCNKALPTGGIQVNKAVDTTGGGTYVDGNQGGFTWQLDNANATSHNMGDTVSGLNAGSSHGINESPSNDYNFTGWYYTNNKDQSCTKGERASNDPPTAIIVPTNDTIAITLCNQRKTGSITIVKNANPDGNQSFDFTTAGNGLSAFSLVDDSSISNTKAFTGLVNGSYSVSEKDVPGWSLKSIKCSEGTNVQVTTSTATITLASGQNVTCTFTNNKLGSIGGQKFNDLNGNGVWDNGEPALANWGIDLHNGNTTTSTTTNASGYYLFSDLSDGSYSLSEQMQSGWTQKVAPNPIDLAIGEDSTGKDFGNQGHGTITVIKKVDSNGDGKVDQTDATDWNWDLGGQDSYQTGSGNAIDVVAGDYTVSEHQKDGYHVSYSDCYAKDSEEDSWVAETADTSVKVTVNANDSIVCVFTNTRDTGTITVNKVLKPSYDDGTFDLNVDGQAEASNVGNGGSTGQVLVTTGTHSISESGYGDTNLYHYYSTYWCSNEVSGVGTEITELDVSKDQNITCTFKNVRYAKVVVTKFLDENENGYWDGGEPALPDWTINLDKTCYSFGSGLIKTSVIDECNSQYNSKVTNDWGNAKFYHLLPGKYNLSEDLKDGWEQSGIYCQNPQVDSVNIFGQTQQFHKKDNLNIWLKSGETKYCYIGNHLKPNMTIDKSNDKPNPVLAGTTVDYTITVKVPDVEHSGRVYGTSNCCGREKDSNYQPVRVTDVLPAGFDYVSGSWTATSSVRGDLKAAGITGEPVNGVWDLTSPDSNYLLPGEVITLTYQAKIESSVTPGTYTNTAFVKGYDAECDGQDVTGTNANDPSTPFATSSVTVYAPQVLGASTLVNTGATFQPLQFVLPAMMILGTALLAMMTRRQAQKGTK